MEIPNRQKVCFCVQETFYAFSFRNGRRLVSEDEFFDFTYWYTYFPIRVLYGRYQGIRVLHGRGTTKIDFCVGAEPDDELSKFHSDRKFAFVS